MKNLLKAMSVLVLVAACGAKVDGDPVGTGGGTHAVTGGGDGSTGGGAAVTGGGDGVTGGGDGVTGGGTQTSELPPLPDRQPEIFAPTYQRAQGIEYVDFDTLVASPTDYAGRTIETRGIVRASCQVRGCWMEVRSVRDAKSESLTVRFVNYSFFVPLDSRSADVRFQGVVKIQNVPANQVADYEAEGYVFTTKNADGSVTLVEFTANGVEMWRKL